MKTIVYISWSDLRWGSKTSLRCNFVWAFFFWERFAGKNFPMSYIGRRPIKPVLRWKRMFRAFQNFCQTLKKTFLEKVRSIWKKKFENFCRPKKSSNIFVEKIETFQISKFQNFRFSDFFDFQNFRFSEFSIFIFSIFFNYFLWIGGAMQEPMQEPMFGVLTEQNRHQTRILGTADPLLGRKLRNPTTWRKITILEKNQWFSLILPIFLVNFNVFSPALASRARGGV